jgi:acyl carrier protein
VNTEQDEAGAQSFDADELRRWLISRAARYVKRPAAEIDGDTPLSQYGMDSVSAVAVAVDLEDEFGIVLDVDTLWKYPTVNSVVGLLMAEHRPAARN